MQSVLNGPQLFANFKGAEICRTGSGLWPSRTLEKKRTDVCSSIQLTEFYYSDSLWVVGLCRNRVFHSFYPGCLWNRAGPVSKRGKEGEQNCGPHRGSAHFDFASGLGWNALA